MPRASSFLVIISVHHVCICCLSYIQLSPPKASMKIHPKSSNQHIFKLQVSINPYQIIILARTIKSTQPLDVHQAPPGGPNYTICRSRLIYLSTRRIGGSTWIRTIYVIVPELMTVEYLPRHGVALVQIRLSPLDSKKGK